MNVLVSQAIVVKVDLGRFPFLARLIALPDRLVKCLFEKLKFRTHMRSATQGRFTQPIHGFVFFFNIVSGRKVTNNLIYYTTIDYRF